VKPRTIPDFSDRQGVWVFAEQRDGNLTRVSLELLGKARELAEELGQEVSAVLLGHQISALTGTLVDYGADKVYYTDHEILKSYRSNEPPTSAGIWRPGYHGGLPSV
jgi:electron transfer flavoprotein alpha subunit